MVGRKGHPRVYWKYPRTTTHSARMETALNPKKYHPSHLNPQKLANLGPGHYLIARFRLHTRGFRAQRRPRPSSLAGDKAWKTAQARITALHSQSDRTARKNRLS